MAYKCKIPFRVRYVAPRRGKLKSEMLYYCYWYNKDALIVRRDLDDSLPLLRLPIYHFKHYKPKLPLSADQQRAQRFKLKSTGHRNIVEYNKIKLAEHDKKYGINRAQKIAEYNNKGRSRES